LAAYLNDHLAGSVVGVELARRIVKQNAGNEYGRRMAEIAEEIEEDRAELRTLMDRLGIRQRQIRLGIAWVGEKIGRLKPNGQLVGYSPLSRVIELEGLVIGITGKLELWRSLQVVDDQVHEFDEAEIKRLTERAESQRERVEGMRIRAAEAALG
jgi:hypothetical protein